MKNPRAHSQRPCPNGGFALVITLVMVALLAIIAIGVLTSVSLERATATSYSNRYQAELAAQNGLQAAAKTLAATPTGTTSITGTDTFLVVRADAAPDANGNKATYYYLAQPAPSPGNSITYYPLFSASTDPSTPTSQTTTIGLTAPFAPSVPTPAPPPNSTASDRTAAWNAAGTQRLPALYPWIEPSPSPSGPSVKWVQMRDPRDAPAPAPPSLPYTRYAYWAEDLDGYLDASQVNDPNAVNTRANGTGIGTTPGEIAMFTIFAPTQQTVNPTPAPVTNLLGSTEIDAQNKRPLLFTVPTVQQIAATTPDLAGPNLAVRLGMDNNPGEQNLIPLGYGYTGEGTAKTNLNYSISQLISANGNAGGTIPLGTALPAFQNRSIGNGAFNYLTNLAADIADYAAPQNAPTDFNPPGNFIHAANSYRGIGAFPLVVSVYDLNNWVANIAPSGKQTTYQARIEVKTYVQLWNPHNIQVGPATFTLQYQNSDQVSYNGGAPVPIPSATPSATITLATGAPSDPYQPVITSSLNAAGRRNKSFSYQITANVPNKCSPMAPNSYLVVVLPGPTVTSYSATGLPPGLTVSNTGLISGTPTTTGTFNVTITALNSEGTPTNATLVITINP